MIDDDPENDLASAILAHAEMNETADYLQRGRALAQLSDSELSEAWVVRFKAWFAEKSDASVRDMDGATAELRLRKLPRPDDRVQEELAQLRAIIHKMGPDAESPRMDAAIEEFMAARRRPKN